MGRLCFEPEAKIDKSKLKGMASTSLSELGW